MEHFYILTSKEFPFFITETNLNLLQASCQASEFQFIDTSIFELELSNNYIDEWPDFIYENGIPLISENFKEKIFDKYRIDYIFYKKILLTQTSKGIKELYWLALPIRINCLDKNKSIFNNYFAEKLCINPAKIGIFEIFKIQDCNNIDIIITDSLKNNIKKLIDERELDNSILFKEI